MENLQRLESDLWEAADQLRANSKLTAAEYSLPVLGLIFLRHAYNRFLVVKAEVEPGLPTRGGVRAALQAAHFQGKAAIYLPRSAQYSYLVDLPEDQDAGAALVQAMEQIEAQVPMLAGALPKEYTRFEPKLLRDLLRIFNRDALQNASGDVFGRIYEYFLNKFAMSGAQEGGEFFTPPALVRLIVNIIEPERGIVFDPACGSGGMFVWTGYFLNEQGSQPAQAVTFKGQEKAATNTRLSRMNLAVHGLEGDIKEGNTFYERREELIGQCDYVMANPPFNVDGVDPARLKNDARLPFGLPGTAQKSGAISNANYLWIQYFYAYLNERGRAGFVMASSASDAGHSEKALRQKLLQTGHVDAVVAIGTNFFYTLTLPCTLWFFDKRKPAERRDKVLMIDARSIYRVVTRKIRDFSDEQLANLTALAWLYRGETRRYLGLVQRYLTQAHAAPLRECLPVLDELAATVAQALKTAAGSNSEGGREPALPSPLSHNFPAEARSAGNREEPLPSLPLKGREQAPQDLSLLPSLEGRAGERFFILQHSSEGAGIQTAALLADWEAQCTWLNAQPLESNAQQHAARQRLAAFEPRFKQAQRQINESFKQAQKAVESAEKTLLARRDALAIRKTLERWDAARQAALEALHQALYFLHQATWLQERFPDAQYADVAGLCKVVTLAEIESKDASLTPGRYVGIVPEKLGENDEFESRITDIHAELQNLNDDAVDLAQVIQKNFEALNL